jgi:hypothetical protein
MFKKITLLTCIFSIAFLNMLPIGYGFFDQTTNSVPQNIQIGNWTRFISIEDLNEETKEGFFNLFGVSTLADLYNNPTFSSIMSAASCTGTGCSSANNYTINDVNINGILFQVNGIASESSGRRSVGFLRTINRDVNASNVPLFPVLPPETTDPNIDYFTAYDIRNQATNNQFSLRLDNQIVLTTQIPVQNLESVSFYALRGIRADNNDRLNNRTLVVEISPNGSTNWQTIGNITVQAPPTNIDVYSGIAVSANFPFYQFNLTTNQINNAPLEGYYIRITYNGEVQGGGNNATKSRVIIDELSFNQISN